MANLSFSHCRSLRAFKTAQGLPLLKNPGLDSDELANYRPILNLSTISKILERLTLNKLRPHLLGSRHYSLLDFSQPTALDTQLRPLCSTCWTVSIAHLRCVRYYQPRGAVTADGVRVRSFRHCSLLAPFIPDRSPAVREARALLVCYVAVYHRRAAGLRPGPAAVHGLRRADWWRHRIFLHELPPVRWRYATLCWNGRFQHDCSSESPAEYCKHNSQLDLDRVSSVTTNQACVDKLLCLI